MNSGGATGLNIVHCFLLHGFERHRPVLGGTFFSPVRGSDACEDVAIDLFVGVDCEGKASELSLVNVKYGVPRTVMKTLNAAFIRYFFSLVLLSMKRKGCSAIDTTWEAVLLASGGYWRILDEDIEELFDCSVFCSTLLESAQRVLGCAVCAAPLIANEYDVPCSCLSSMAGCFNDSRQQNAFEACSLPRLQCVELLLSFSQPWHLLGNVAYSFHCDRLFDVHVVLRQADEGAPSAVDMFFNPNVARNRSIAPPVAHETLSEGSRYTQIFSALSAERSYARSQRTAFTEQLVYFLSLPRRRDRNSFTLCRDSSRIAAAEHLAKGTLESAGRHPQLYEVLRKHAPSRKKNV